jgi:hypothetical protein
MTSYPKWIYSATEPPRVVADAAEHAAAGPGWVESPALVSGGSVTVAVPDLAVKRGRQRKVTK